MNAILNNLITLAATGAFGNDGIIIPMSQFKWNILCKIAELEDISPYVSKGIQKFGDESAEIIVPNGESYANISREAKETLRNSVFNNSDNIKFDLDITDIDSLRLTYILKKYILKDIIDKERHSIDTSKTSLDFLSLIVQNTDVILRQGIRLRGIIEIGRFLRTKGQYVDFIKVETWLNKLKLMHIATMQASVLTDLFSFEKDEFPYIKKIDKKSKSLAEYSLNRIYRANKRSREFSKYNIRNCIKFFKYTRSEALCKAFYIMGKGLADIEE